MSPLAKLKNAKVRPRARAKPAAPQAKPRDPGADWETRELEIERDRLVEKFTIMQTDLGGAFYEMAIRDHVNLDALTRKAAELQKVDRELGEIERKLSGGPKS
jgi:hypothetical protein